MIIIIDFYIRFKAKDDKLYRSVDLVCEDLKRLELDIKILGSITYNSIFLVKSAKAVF